MSTIESAAPQPLKITTFRSYLFRVAEQKRSISLTTCQIGELFLQGLKSSDEMSMFERR
ncbi:MAG: hypothetical protein Q7R66_18220 [Undibacterium sp.]|uniref:hypothetical protein n=1 Tax=Undibacterium sp. TaxID=1914977 RepID=UPI002716C625|nr:hypothetical protein [Undibacterium sp.]MDO8654111.1 hypothetical protein [Undibacterium sp.]